MPELLGQIVGLKLDLDSDRTGVVSFGLEPHDRAIISIEPFAHGSQRLWEGEAIERLADQVENWENKRLATAAD